MSITEEKPGIKEHILAALTRPMGVAEIVEATSYKASAVIKALDNLYEQHRVITSEEGWQVVNPAIHSWPAPARPPRTVAEYEQLEEQAKQNGHAEPSAAPPASQSHMLPRVALTNIQESAINPRQTFDPQELAELAESITQHGLLEPLLLRPNLSGDDRPFELLAGARRFRACQLAGVEHVPAVVRLSVSDAQALAMMIAENEDRADLNPIERANAYRRLSELGVPNKEIARSAGLSPSRISNTLAVLDLSQPLQQQVAGGKLSEAHGRALLRHPESIREALAAHAVATGLPSKALDVDTHRLEWGIVYALRDAGAVRLHAMFDLCKECPHGARIGGNDPWCTNPTCYQEQSGARTAALDAANQQALTSARDMEIAAGRIATDQALPTMQQLLAEHPGATALWGSNPAGCSEQCECRRQTQHAGTGGKVEITQCCINPDRLKGLREAEHAVRDERLHQQQAAQEEIAETERQSLLQSIQARPDDPALLTAAVARLVWTGEMDLVPEVLGRHAPDIAEMMCDGDFEPTMHALAKLPLDTLIRIAGELAILEPDEAGESISHWFLSQPPAAGLSAAPAGPDKSALLKTELRSVQSQLESAQALLRKASPIVHDTQVEALQASTQRAREEADAAKGEIIKQQTRIKRLQTGHLNLDWARQVAENRASTWQEHAAKVQRELDELRSQTAGSTPQPEPTEPAVPQVPSLQITIDDLLQAADRQDQVTAVVPDDTPAPRTPTGDDARNVECPQCHAAPRHDCRRPRGGSRPVIGYHPERYEAAASMQRETPAVPDDLDTPGGGPDGPEPITLTCAGCGMVETFPNPMTPREDWPQPDCCWGCQDRREKPPASAPAEEPISDPLEPNYAVGMRHVQSGVREGGAYVACLRCEKVLRKGHRYVQTHSGRMIHATCLTHEERMAFETPAAPGVAPAPASAPASEPAPAASAEPVPLRGPYLCKGEAVRVLEGEFEGQTGTIAEVDAPGILYQVKLPGLKQPALLGHGRLESVEAATAPRKMDLGPLQAVEQEAVNA